MGTQRSSHNTQGKHPYYHESCTHRFVYEEESAVLRPVLAPLSGELSGQNCLDHVQTITRHHRIQASARWPKSAALTPWRPACATTPGPYFQLLARLGLTEGV